MEQQHGGGSKQNSKTLRKRLQRQLEFYLSESNLRADKFLQQSMDEQGFIAIELFLGFNKLKVMKATEKMVRDAAEKSSLIRISADRGAIAPVELPFDKDDTSQGARTHMLIGDNAQRTVYIENFGVEDDHDSLRKRLSKFGKVNLVSMPRFPQSKRFKGFAFVEFASAQVAEDAIKAALAMDPELQGLRAMSKVRWQEMKQQLKDQLAVAALQGEEQVEGKASDRSTKLDQRQSKEAREGEPELDLKPRGAQKKRKTGGGHIYFDADDEDEAENNQEQPQQEMQSGTKRQKAT